MSKRIIGERVTGHSQARTIGKLAAMREFPPAVYAARLADGTIKIGWSNSLDRRLEGLGAGVELLALRPGTRAEETAIHRSLKGRALRGREWYPPIPEVLAVVNELRAACNLPSLAA